jgi:hypothetical protein
LPADQSIPELLINPEKESFAGTGAGVPASFGPSGSVPKTGVNDMAEELQLSPEFPSARVAPSTVRTGGRGLISDEPWNSAPIGANQSVRGAANANRLTKSSRRRRNPLVELVKMIVGGIVGLAVGYAILLWVFRVDPFQLARYLPAAILPAQLKTSETSGTSGNDKGDGAGIAINPSSDALWQAVGRELPSGMEAGGRRSDLCS